MGRRAFLGATTVGAAGLSSGCLSRLRSLMARDTPEQVSLDITTVPADEDSASATIARRLEQNLSAVGVDVGLSLKREDEFQRKVLINHDYDIFIGQCPSIHDPDFLRPLLHSTFANESGWANPFNFTNLDVDDLLVEQRRRRGFSRRESVASLQHTIAREQPFTVLGFPQAVGGVRNNRFSGWNEFPLRSPLSYLGLTPESEESEQLRLATTDARVTQNLNPIAVEFRNQGPIMDLLYEPLARQFGGSVRPWLAEDWSSGSSDTTAITVRLRDDLRWHDGTPLTADDVAFTFEFLADTTLGEREFTVPAPRFQDRISLVGTATVIDDQHVRLTFPDVSQPVARSALTVPILPRHEWEDTSSRAEVGGVNASNHVTEALVRSNSSPVGSGVLQFAERSAGESLGLKRFDDHFLHQDPPSALTDRFGEGVAFSELDLRVLGSDEAVVSLLGSDEIEATVSSLHPRVVPDIGQEEAVQLRVDDSRSFYLIGFNATQEPLGNPRFRRLVGRLLDKSQIVSEVFNDYAAPAVSPLTGTDWLPPDLEWDGTDPEVPFLGTNGQLDEDAARNSLRDAGFQFSESGELLWQ